MTRGLKERCCISQVAGLDPNTIQARVDETHRQNYKQVKARPTDAVTAALKADLDAFKEQLPLLQEVCAYRCGPLPAGGCFYWHSLYYWNSCATVHNHSM
jgi:hypothetical protein